MATAYENSAIVIGLIADGRLNPMEVPDGTLISPWDKTLKALHANPLSYSDKTQRDLILSQTLMPTLLQEAHAEASRFNGLGESGVFDFVGGARNSTNLFNLSLKLEAASKRARENATNEDTLLKLRTELDKVITSGIIGLKPSNEYKAAEYVPYVKSGIEWVDEVLQGYPTTGLINVVAPEYTGKTYLGFLAACSWAVEHPDYAPPAIYTVEMPAEEYISRNIRMYPQFKKLLEAGKVLISDTITSVGEVVAEVNTREVSFVVVDHIGYLVKDTTTEAYDKVYKSFVQLQRLKKIPIMLLIQSNRENKKAGGFLDKWAAEWSSEAEKSASYLWTLNKADPMNETTLDDRFPCLLDNPNQTCGTKKPTPRYFVCVWKDRNAAMKYDMQAKTGVGAIRIEPNPQTGYYDQMWIGKAYKGRLWGVNEHKHEMPQRPAPQLQTVSGQRKIVSDSDI